MQCGPLSLFLEGESSLAEEPGLVSRAGGTRRAAGRGRPQVVQGASPELRVGRRAGVELVWAGKPQRVRMMPGTAWTTRLWIDNCALAPQTLLGA